MNRPSCQRLWIFVSLVVPVTLILTASRQAEAQPGSFRMETHWKCSKCGGNLGNGVNPPTKCPRCGVRLRPDRDRTSSWYDPSGNNSRYKSGQKSNETSSPLSTAAAIAIAGVALVVLGVIVMKDWGPDVTTDSK